MSESFENLKNILKKLPGAGSKSAERMALHLALENRDAAVRLKDAIENALENVSACPECGGLSQKGELCKICASLSRNSKMLCVVEHSGDILSVEKSGAWHGKYHVLGGKLSPLKKIAPENLNLEKLSIRIEEGGVEEMLLALSNDIEGESTCRYIQTRIVGEKPIRITRIGFGLPSGSQLGFADSGTIQSALEARKEF